jgi:FeS assembly SUF system protein
MEPQEPQEHPEGSVEAKVVEALKTCYDPEIPVDIYELGLIYAIDVQDVEAEDGDGKKALVTMTLTSPACPVAGTLPGEVQRTVLDQVEELSDSQVDLTWDPPWSIDRMSEAAKLQLGMM